MSETAHPPFVALFTPKLITTLREGYRLGDLRADAVAGITVAIVALPLSMAIAIASGVGPERGLYAAIVGGFIVSMLGGSRFQIGGPAGAFIVLVNAATQAHGIDGVILATLLSGVILLVGGYLKLGTFIKYIPYPVTVGFTAGIAVIILASQLTGLLGLTLPGKEPGELLPKLKAIALALPTTNASAAALAVCSLVLISVLRRFNPRLPAFLIAVVSITLISWLLRLPVETVGTRFGAIPSSLPLPRLPAWSLEKTLEVLPVAASFALLGSIESLLSAVVADAMTGRRHRSNCELVAQGVANVGSALFGGVCVTGTIARTATNVRAGARSPIAGMLHSVFLLLFMVVAAPLARYIPLAVLAAILTAVAWNMAEKHEFATLLRTSRGDAMVLLATFLLVTFRDLTEGILIGFGLGTVLFIHRMAQAVVVERQRPMVEEDVSDAASDIGPAYDQALVTDRDIAVYKISGALFFGAAAAVGAALERIGEQPKAYVVDLSALAMMDSTAAATLVGFCRKVRRAGAAVFFTEATSDMRRLLAEHGLPLQVTFAANVDGAVAMARAIKIEG